METNETHFHVSHYSESFPVFLLRTEDAQEALDYFVPLCSMLYTDLSLSVIEMRVSEVLDSRGKDGLFFMTAAEDYLGIVLYNCKSKCAQSPSFN